MLLAALSIALIMVMSVPVNHHPFRSAIFCIILGRKEDFSKKENIVATALFSLLTCTVAVLFPSITAVLQIIGGLCSVTMCYLIPTYAYVKLSKQRWYQMKNLLPLLFFGILIVIGYTSVIITFITIIRGEEYMGKVAVNRPDIHIDGKDDPE